MLPRLGRFGHVEIDVHQGEDRPYEPLRLVHGQPEDESERQRGRDREIRAPLLPPGVTGRRQRVTASHRRAARAFARTPANSQRDIRSHTSEKSSTSWRDRAPPVINRRSGSAIAYRSAPEEPCTNACAGKARSRGTRCRDVIFETLFETLWVSNPIRPRSAASRNRVMRGPGVTQGAKRSQGARRPRD